MKKTNASLVDKLNMKILEASAKFDYVKVRRLTELLNDEIDQDK